MKSQSTKDGIAGKSNKKEEKKYTFAERSSRLSLVATFFPFFFPLPNYCSKIMHNWQFREWICLQTKILARIHHEAPDLEWNKEYLQKIQSQLSKDEIPSTHKQRHGKRCRYIKYTDTRYIYRIRMNKWNLNMPFLSSFFSTCEKPNINSPK